MPVPKHLARLSLPVCAPHPLVHSSSCDFALCSIVRHTSGLHSFHQTPEISRLHANSEMMALSTMCEPDSADVAMLGDQSISERQHDVTSFAAQEWFRTFLCDQPPTWSDLRGAVLQATVSRRLLVSFDVKDVPVQRPVAPGDSQDVDDNSEKPGIPASRAPAQGTQEVCLIGSPAILGKWQPQNSFKLKASLALDACHPSEQETNAANGTGSIVDTDNSSIQSNTNDACCSSAAKIAVTAISDAITSSLSSRNWKGGSQDSDASARPALTGSEVCDKGFNLPQDPKHKVVNEETIWKSGWLLWWSDWSTTHSADGPPTAGSDSSRSTMREGREECDSIVRCPEFKCIVMTEAQGPADGQRSIEWEQLWSNPTANRCVDFSTFLSDVSARGGLSEGTEAGLSQGWERMLDLDAILDTARSSMLDCLSKLEERDSEVLFGGLAFLDGETDTPLPEAFITSCLSLVLPELFLYGADGMSDAPKYLQNSINLDCLDIEKASLACRDMVLEILSTFAFPSIAFVSVAFAFSHPETRVNHLKATTMLEVLRTELMPSIRKTLSRWLAKRRDYMRHMVFTVDQEKALGVEKTGPNCAGGAAQQSSSDTWENASFLSTSAEEIDVSRNFQSMHGSPMIPLPSTTCTTDDGATPIDMESSTDVGKGLIVPEEDSFRASPTRASDQCSELPVLLDSECRLGLQSDGADISPAQSLRDVRNLISPLRRSDHEVPHSENDVTPPTQLSRSQQNRDVEERIASADLEATLEPGKVKSDTDVINEQPSDSVDVRAPANTCVSFSEGSDPTISSLRRRLPLESVDLCPTPSGENAFSFSEDLESPRRPTSGVSHLPRFRVIWSIAAGAFLSICIATFVSFALLTKYDW